MDQQQPSSSDHVTQPPAASHGDAHDPKLYTDKKFEFSKYFSFSTLKNFKLNLPQKFFLLTVCFVFLAEIIVFMPSIANYRYDWLDERVSRAYLIALAVDRSELPYDERREMIKDLYGDNDILGLGLEHNGMSELILRPDLNENEESREMRSLEVDLSVRNMPKLMMDAVSNLFTDQHAYLVVRGQPDGNQEMTVELLIHKVYLRDALREYTLNLFWLSLFIGGIVSVLIYFSLLFLFVRPMLQMMNNMARFQRQPDNMKLHITPRNSQDEFGMAERALADMQGKVYDALQQQKKMAALGIGMSKVNHDLRNVLASAVLMSERLAKSDDPRVQSQTPRLVKALNRAVALCKATLDYGRIETLQRKEHILFDIVADAEDALHPLIDELGNHVVIVNNIEPDIMCQVDRAIIFRAFLNLLKNAIEILDTIYAPSENNPHPKTKGMVNIHAKIQDNFICIQIKDNGHGIPAEAQEYLFVPFKGSKRGGGTGLGLAIAYESVRAHHGDLRLIQSAESGSVFEIRLPI